MALPEAKSPRELALEAENRRLRRLLEEAGRDTGEARTLVEDQFAEFDRVSASLIRSGELLRRVLAGSGDCIKILDLDARLQFMSSGGRAVMEVDDFAPLAGCPWLEFWTGEYGPAARRAVAEAAAGRRGRFQGPCATAKGTPKWWDVQVLPLVGPDGKPEQLLSISTDITAQRLAEGHQRVLMQELEHRVKNTLALVQSVANQTFRDAASLDAARRIFTDRLLALGKAHEILTRTSWNSAGIDAIVGSVIAPYLDAGQRRFQVTGPEVSLAAKPALALTMALHELCTNALKYGALSAEHGRVLIEWKITGRRDDPRLRFVWTERDGPAVQPPQHKGFGSQLIERLLAAEFSGEVVLAFEAAGIVCAVDAPLAAIQQPQETDALSMPSAVAAE